MVCVFGTIFALMRKTYLLENKVKKLFVCLFVFMFAGTANAGIISIDYDFADRSLEFNGITQSTGGIEMSIVVDTNTANLGSGFGDWQNFYNVDVFFTSVGLGLNNERVVSNTYLYFGSSVFGFTDTINNFGTIFTAYGTSNLDFGSQFDLSTLLVPQGPLAATGNELRTANDIVFANGDRITGGGTISLASTTTVSDITTVPEPTTFAILALGLAGIGLSRKKKVI